MNTDRCCPCCGAETREIIYHQKFSELTLITGYGVAICLQCGMGYATPCPSQDDLNLYYSKMSKYEDSHAADDARITETVETLYGIISHFDSVLDVGCANGRILEGLRSRGYEYLFGATHASTIVGREYDFIILSNVLEHVRDCRELLRQLYDKLSPNGRLWVEVPDPTVLGNDAPYQQFSTEHINYFSLQSLVSMLEGAGFSALQAEYSKDAIRGLFSRGVLADRSSKIRLLHYITESQARDESLSIPEGPFLVWGTGALTLRLLAQGTIPIESVFCFVDSNRNYQGKVVEGKLVIAPGELRDEEYSDIPILIASFLHGPEIEAQIQQMGLKNKIVRIG
jgi:SAM-dependent methyltransferase